MSIKIENKAVDGGGDTGFREYVLTLRALEVGQSFVTKLPSSYRIALSVAQILLDREFVTRKEGASGLRRVGRVA